jgi:hypothetical protein
MPEEYRAYHACKLFGWTYAEYDAAPAAFVDLAFMFDAAENEKAEQ